MMWQASVDKVFAVSQKVGLTRATFFLYILPPVVGLYLMGVLVQLDGTRLYRLALLPIIVWCSWRGIFVDMSGGDPKMAMTNVMLITHMCSFAMRATAWAVATEPLRRQSPSNKHSSSNVNNIYTACWNTWDLLSSTRGLEWNRPRGLVVPKPTYETDSRFVFVILSAARLAIYVLGFDVCVQVMHALSPDAFGSLNGGSLFDPTLPPLLQVSRSVLMSALAAWLAYFSIQWCYQFLAIIGVAVFRYRPAQWPPLFDDPWLSTSLTEFWGRRWHQMMRELVVTLGMRPFGYLSGRFGGLFGAFLVSGVFHDIELRSIGRGGNTVIIVGFWVMNAVGIVLERMWKKATGKKVGGVLGWLWTFGWLAVWGVWVVDVWARAGRFGMLSLPGDVQPSLMLWRSLVG